jgi:hypothetical protein
MAQVVLDVQATPGQASTGTSEVYVDSTTKRLASVDDANTKVDYAPAAAPTFTGVPAAPTAAQDTNTTQLATCAFCIGQNASQAQMETATSTTLHVPPGRQHFHPGHPKCWGKATVSAGTPTLQVSYGLTSITDTATGEIQWTFTTAFSTANYCTQATCENIGTTYAVANTRRVQIRNATGLVGSVILDCLDGTATTNLLADPASWHMTSFGDFA